MDGELSRAAAQLLEEEEEEEEGAKKKKKNGLSKEGCWRHVAGRFSLAGSGSRSRSRPPEVPNWKVWNRRELDKQ